MERSPFRLSWRACAGQQRPPRVDQSGARDAPRSWLCGARRDFYAISRSYHRDTTKVGDEDALPNADQFVPLLALSGNDSDYVFPARTTRSSRNGRSSSTSPARDGSAGLVMHYEHVCRRCKHKGRPHSEKHEDAELRPCETCGVKMWPRAIPRHLRFHDLRDTTASLLLNAGVDAFAVQHSLRHTDPRITTEVYGHLVPGYLRDAINTLPLAGAADLLPASGESEEKEAPFGPPVVRNLPSPKKEGRIRLEKLQRNPAF